jgi:hypothetical protein
MLNVTRNDIWMKRKVVSKEEMMCGVNDRTWGI